MPDAALPVLVSVGVVSVVSFVGVSALALGPVKARGLLPLLVALAAGALLGDALMHLLPEAVETAGGFTAAVGGWTLAGLLGFFAVESLIHWHHHGEDVAHHAEGHVSSYVWMNLLGDGIHNFIDGALIAGTWMASPEAGMATTLAVALHEIPQEFGDFGVLVHGGLPVRRALLLNVASAGAAFLGAFAVLLTGHALSFETALVAVAAGGFLYVACADLVPELHKRARGKQLLATAGALALGLALVIWLPVLLGEHGHGHEHGESEPPAHEHPAGD
ncbi:MAG: ZIP family metal transporter [Planctomycetota bacterium]|jgi:zinc and cadmium transporter